MNENLEFLTFAHTFLLEIPGVILLIAISIITWLTHRGSQTASTITIIGAFAITALNDFTHAVMSYVDLSLLHDWVPYTWAVSRTTLITMIVIGLFLQAKKISAEWIGYMMVLVGIIASYALDLLPLYYPDVLAEITFVQNDNGELIKRLLDIFPLILYAGVFWACQSGKLFQIVLPSAVRIFIGVGVLVHLPMVFGSSSFMDPWFSVAHGLKNLEYLVWLWFAWTDYQLRLLSSHDTFMQGKAHVLYKQTKDNLDSLNDSVERLKKMSKEKHG